MQAIAFGILVLASVALAGDVDFRTCGSANKATIRRFGVSGCADGATSCTFIKGQSYDFEIEGRAHDDAPDPTHQLHFKVTGSVLGIPITLLEGDACHNLTEPYRCPIFPGEHIELGLRADIGASTPALNNVLVTARIWGNTVGTNPNALACAQITVTIRNAADLKNLVESMQKHQ